MEPTHTRVLPNGIRLVAVPRAGTPLAAVVLRVGVGSADEEPGEEGLAHVLEHMVVRCAMDGGRVGDGALVTARTGKEATVYSAVVRRADAVLAVAALGPVLGRLDVPREDLAAELTAIREERAQRSADPARRLQDSLMGALWPGTRCAHPVLGDPRVVDALTPQRVRRFHHRWYRPAGAALVIVADGLDGLLPPIAAAASAWGHGHPAAADPAVTYGQVPGAADAGRERAPRPAERPAAGAVAAAHGQASGIAFARPGGDSAAAVLACDAVKAATGLVLHTLPLRDRLCTWAMVRASGPAAAGDVVRAALAAAHARITRPDGAAWLRTEVLIPRLRTEDDVEALATRAADPRTAVGTDELAACPAGAVGDLLTEWRRRFGAERVT
ncbi:insulinase family protein [Streptomyces roseifaciens]